MYKITLYDYNCSPICSGTRFWFVEDLEEFEKKWLPLQSIHGVSTIERYYRSKLGEIVTDYYSHDPELNIVQKVDSEVISEKEYTYTDKEICLVNTYGFATKVLFDSLEITLRVVKENNEYYLAGQYIGNGCRRVERNWNRWYNKEVQYCQMGFYGNPVAEYYRRDINWDDWDKSDCYKDFYTNDKDFYKHERVKTFVWLPIKKVSEDYCIEELTEEEFRVLMADIVGEAG